MEIKVNTKYNPGDIVYIVLPLSHEIEEGEIVMIWVNYDVFPKDECNISYAVKIKGEDHPFYEPEDCVFSNIADAENFAK